MLQVTVRITEAKGRRGSLVMFMDDGEHPQMLNLGKGHSL